MYLVVKGFANNEISATKGKIINLNKKDAASLLDAGYIVDAKSSKADDKEKDKIISSLEETNETLANRVSELEEENKKLLDKLAELEALSEYEEPAESVAKADSNVNEDNIDNEESTENELESDSDDEPVEDKNKEKNK